MAGNAFPLQAVGEDSVQWGFGLRTLEVEGCDLMAFQEDLSERYCPQRAPGEALSSEISGVGGEKRR